MPVEIWYVNICRKVYMVVGPRQPACMKLGISLYSTAGFTHACCLGYLVHTCNLPMDIQQVPVPRQESIWFIILC